MIDVRLFADRRFSAALVVNLVSIFVAAGYFLFVAQYLQLVVGLSPLQAGLWSVPSAAGFIVGSQVAPHVVAGVDAGRVLVVGLALSAAGLGLLTQIGGSADLGLLVGASVVISLGLAPAHAGDRPDRRIGTAGAGRCGVGDR